MVTVRLSKKIEQQLAEITQIENVTRTDIIKNALQNYLDKYSSSKSAFNAGEDLFGKYGSTVCDKSMKYKQYLKDKLLAKFSN